MKATEAKLIEFLKKAAQFVIPIYQRTYSWGEKEYRQLSNPHNDCSDFKPRCNDVEKNGSDKLRGYFVGTGFNGSRPMWLPRFTVV
jgi:hypothetical protein